MISYKNQWLVPLKGGWVGRIFVDAVSERQCDLWASESTPFINSQVNMLLRHSARFHINEEPGLHGVTMRPACEMGSSQWKYCFCSILCLSVFSHEHFYLSFVLLVFFHSARIFYSTLYASCFLRLPPLCLVSLYVLFFLRLSYSLWISLSCFSFIALFGPQGAGCCYGKSWLKSEMGTYLQSLWNGTWVERKTLGRKSLFTYAIFISFGSLITRSKWNPL